MKGHALVNENKDLFTKKKQTKLVAKMWNIFSIVIDSSWPVISEKNILKKTGLKNAFPISRDVFSMTLARRGSFELFNFRGSTSQRWLSSGKKRNEDYCEKISREDKDGWARIFDLPERDRQNPGPLGHQKAQLCPMMIPK